MEKNGITDFGFWAEKGLRTGILLDKFIFKLTLKKYWDEIKRNKKAGKTSRLNVSRFGQLVSIAKKIAKENVPGDYVEFGTWRGGSLYLVAKIWKELNFDRNLLGFDSFEGLPELNPKNDNPKLFQGMFGIDDLKNDRNNNYEDVLRLFNDNNIDNVKLIKGWFKDTISQLDERRISFCHIDADVYDSVKIAIEHTYDLVAPGGIILFDDYGHPECSGATIAAEEFFAHKKENILQSPFVDCSAWVQKQ